jgi:hypothetical protein
MKNLIFYFYETVQQTVSIFMLPHRMISPSANGIARAPEGARN